MKPMDGPAVERVRPSALAVVRWAVAFGLIGGALELGAFLLKCLVLDPRNFNVSRQFPWMFPAAGVLLTLAAGSGAAIASRCLPALFAARVVLGVILLTTSLGVLFRVPIYTAACLILAAGVASEGSGRLARRLDGFDRLVRRGLPWLLAAFVATVLGGVIAGARATAARPVPRDAKNVLLIVLDTVRADSLSLYGYPRETTPNLRRLAERGVRFDRAFSTAPWTAPSHAGMFTGRRPRELSVGWNRPLDRRSPTLAEHLGRRGYDTAGFVANTTYCSYETGLDRGFAHYEDYDVDLREVLLRSSVVQRTLNALHRRPAIARRVGLGEVSLGSGRKSASRINRDFLRWLDRHGDRPYFAFLNYFDAHHPYVLPEGADAPRFGPGPASPDDERLLRTWWDADKRGLDPRRIALARDAYDRCIAYLDAELGKLIAELERRGEMDRTLIVVTADHGEAIGEHGLYGHGCSLYLPELHVPLLVVAPGRAPAGRVVSTPVTLADLPATVVDLIDPAARSPFPGRTLAATWSDRASSTRAPVIAELDEPPDADPNKGSSPVCAGPLRTLIDDQFHYIRRADGREELYRTTTDPAEREDLGSVPRFAATLDRFRALLNR